MKVDVVLNANQIVKERIKDKLIIAIDTFRATTTIITALANGAKEVIPVENSAKALNYRRLSQDIILAGERNGKKISQLDLGNSPLSYNKEIIKDKKIVLTTTNGTKLLLNLIGAKKVYIAAFINLMAAAKRVLKEDEIIICCAGMRGDFSLEDFMTAGGLVHKLKELDIDLELTDGSLAAYQSYLMNKDDLIKVLSQSRNGSRLISLGKEGDVNYALKENRFDLVPIYKKGRIII